MTLDHLFILVRPWQSGQSDFEAARELAASFETAGFSPGSDRRHPGQGTENRCFRFERFMFELLFLVSREEAGSARSAPLSLIERRDDDAASPFGFASRPSGPKLPEPPEPSGSAETSGFGAPYPHTLYHPLYLPPDVGIAIARDVPVTEPLWFHLPPVMLKSAGRTPAAGETDAASFHPNGVQRLDAVTLATPMPLAARSADIAARLGIVVVAKAPEQRLTLSFDAGAQRRRIVPHPALPLAIEC